VVLLGRYLTWRISKQGNVWILYMMLYVSCQKVGKTLIKIDDLCAFVCSFFKLSAGDVMNAINEWEKVGVMSTESNAIVFLRIIPA